MRTDARSLLLSSVVAFASLAQPRVASADLDCPSASEEGQRLRDKNRWLEARELFRACSKPTCPGVVRKDCAKWLAEVEEGVPSLVIAAQDDKGNDLANVHVTIDDKPVASRLDGTPIPVDPGEHELRVEADGRPTVTQKLIVRVSEKNRLVRVNLGATETRAPAAATSTVPAPAAEPGHGVPAASWILGGVGVVALGGWGYFGLSGRGDLSDLRSSCAPYCEQGSLDDAKTKLLVADVSLGVGVVALAAAVVIALTHGGPTTSSTASSR